MNLHVLTQHGGLRIAEVGILLGAVSSSRKKTRGLIAAIASACIAVPIVADLGLIGTQHFTDHTKALESRRNSTPMPSPVGRGCERATPLARHYNPRCTWHLADPIGTIVLLGDSNAIMYALPVIKAAESLDYEVTVDGASSCPYVGLRVIRINGEQRKCPGFGTKSIDFMVKSKPSLVVLVARSDFYLQNPQDGFAVVGKGGFTFTNAGKAKLYRQAMHGVLERLSRAGVPVVVVHPVPVLPIDQATCAIVGALTGTCSASLSRASAHNWLRLAIQTENQAAAGVENVSVLSFENQLCGKKRCSTVKNGISLYRDSRHLSVDGAFTLMSEFKNAFDEYAVPRP